MLLSFNWLRQYVNLPDSITAEDVAARLKLSTVEVEKIEHRGRQLENMVVGKVLSCEQHPNADKLKVCTVDVGSEKLQIVCGGSNVKEKMLVAVGKIGAKVRWHGQGDLVELKLTEIRGVESYGMICGANEIGLEELFPLKDEKEIVDLNYLENRSHPLPSHPQAGEEISPPLAKGRIKVGMSLAEALGFNDIIFEIDNKSLSNRSDLWGHYGMAREVAALFHKKLKEYKTEECKEGNEIKLKVNVEDTKHCPRYMAVALRGISVKPSPAWLQTRLRAVGLRPINNIVDITNYVMVDLGQPMHAFDGSQISDIGNQKTIIVRKAKDGEEMVVLDGQKYKLDSSMLVIADAEKALAIAGVKGGVNSGITNDTATIIFESANFDGVSVRATSTRLGLRTDSSARFEKQLDPRLCEHALRRAVALVKELCPDARVASAVVDAWTVKSRQARIETNTGFIAHKLGVPVETREAARALEYLGFTVRVKKEELLISVPSWRARDVTSAEDIVEEVARLRGYDTIPATLPRFPIVPPTVQPLAVLVRTIRNTLVHALAYTDVYNYSFVSPATIQKLGDDPDVYVLLDNPLSAERPYVRRNLIANLLENIVDNSARYDRLRLFEIGKTFLSEAAGVRVKENSDQLLPRQDTWLTVAYTWKKNPTPFWDARRAAEAIMQELTMPWHFAKPKKLLPWQHPSRCGVVLVNEQEIGSVYEVHPLVQERFGLESAVAVVDLNMDKLAALPVADSQYKPMSEFPAVERDIAMVVDATVSHADIEKTILEAASLIQSVTLFDVYEGDYIGKGKKSMAYRIVYAHPQRTLTTDEVNTAQEKVMNMLIKQVNASVR